MLAIDIAEWTIQIWILDLESASEPSRGIHQISSTLANPMDIPFSSTFDKASCGWHACIRHTIFLSGCFRKAN